MAWRSSSKVIRFCLSGVNKQSDSVFSNTTVQLSLRISTPQIRSCSSRNIDSLTEGLHVLSSVEDEEQFTDVFKNYGLHVESRDTRGWTPLMHAAKAGNDRLIQILLDKGASLNPRCKCTHTAADIAQFWKNKASFNLLEPTGAEEREKEDSEELFFGGHFLDRASQLRGNESILDKLLLQKNTQFVLMHKLSPLVKHSEKKLPLLFLADHQTVIELSQVAPKFSLRNSQTVFLGLRHDSQPVSVDSLEERQAVFCVDVSEVDEGLLDKIEPDVEVPSHPLGLLALSPHDAALCAQAKAMLHWHRGNKFCPSCGSRTESTSGGYKRICQNETCHTRNGIHNTSYPRVDPSIISLVINPTQLHCLLARGHHAPPGMYTCLAGFVEPGESVKMACRREVFEEAGVEIEEVEVQTTQPWPAPSVLMIACTAQAKTTELKVDEIEVADARWFSRAEVVDMITKRHKNRFFIPPTQAIAYHLVKNWLKQTAFL